MREEGDGVQMNRTPIRSRMQSTKSCARIVGSAGEVVARARRMQLPRPERHIGDGLRLEGGAVWDTDPRCLRVRTRRS